MAAVAGYCPELPDRRRRLARAGWNVISSSSLAGLPRNEPNMEAEGKRLVKDVASRWSNKYIFHIRPGGQHDGLYHYECLFSLPTQEKPVPSIVISVQFAFLPTINGNPAKLFYSFGESDLRHEWKLVQDSSGIWQPLGGQQKLSLRNGAFESYLDALIREKSKVRSEGQNLATDFEITRLEPPPPFAREQEDEVVLSAGCSRAQSADGSADGSAAFVATVTIKDEMTLAMQDALRAANMYCAHVAPPATMTELFRNVFDAADEEGIGTMRHYEVARLMMATLPGFGLAPWDINDLLGHASENEEGLITLDEFIEFAPDFITALRDRRLKSETSSGDLPEIPMESIKFFYADEIETTVEGLLKAFEDCVNEDESRGIFAAAHRSTTSGDGGVEAETPADVTPIVGEERRLVALTRRHCRMCIASLPERVSPQEGNMLLEMLPEDENGFVNFEGLADMFETLRSEALLNAAVGNSVRALRAHLVQRAREQELDWTAKLKIWKVKDILLRADQLCLSRLQIHMLLCITDPSKDGDVELGTYLGACAAIIPTLTNANVFIDVADRLILEMAEEAKERQNAELAALGAAARITKKDDDEGEKRTEKKEIDQETVERTLIQAFSLMDDTRKTTPSLPPERIFNAVFNMDDQQIQSLCLNELEVAGLMAEMHIDSNGEVPYHDFVRRWVPIMFELREHPLLSRYLQPDATKILGIAEPDLAALEEMCPLLPEWCVKPKPPAESEPASRRGSKNPPRRKGSISSNCSFTPRRPSKEGLQRLPDVPPPGRGFQRRKEQYERQQAAQAAEVAAAAAASAVIAAAAVVKK